MLHDGVPSAADENGVAAIDGGAYKALQRGDLCQGGQHVEFGEDLCGMGEAARLGGNAPSDLGEQFVFEFNDLVLGMDDLCFAALEFGDAMKIFPSSWRIILLAPYIPWLMSFLCSWGAFSPAPSSLTEDAPDATRERLIEAASRKAWWLFAARIFLLLGLTLMVILIGSTYLACGG